MDYRILVTDKAHNILISSLEEKNCIVDYKPDISPSEVDEIIAHYDGIVINSKIIMHEDRIDKGVRLKFIARLGSGLEIIDSLHAKKRKIHVLNSPEGNRDAVAEHEIGMLLSLMNNISIANSELKNGNWQREKNRGIQLMGKTLGIIGFGNTGQALASRMYSWRLNVISYDKYKKHFPKALRFVKRVSLDTLIAEADIISLHLPLSEETKYIVDSVFLSRCKDGVIISNTARGMHIKTKDLISHIHSGKVRGAVLDVFENENNNNWTAEEKLMYKELLAFENVIATPHIAGWTKESLVSIAEVLSKKIIQIL